MAVETHAAPTMRAAVYRKFGPPEVVHIEQVPRPIPRPNEVLIRVHASTVSAADYRMRTRDLPKGLGFLAPLALGIFGPRKRVLGMDISGVVEEVGDAVTKFAPGDEVIGMPGSRFGGHAEYLCLPDDAALAPKPRNMSHDEAVAIVFGGTTSLAFLTRAGIRPGQEVLVNGASGSTGSAAVQIAKHFGARVTAVCSAGNSDLVASLGADEVIDYTSEDFTAGGKLYDVIVDCVGNAPFERVNRSIKPGGSLLLVSADLRGLAGAKRNGRRSGKLVAANEPITRVEGIQFLSRLAEAGGMRAVIDRSYDLDEIVEAHRYVSTWRKRGNLVVRIAAG